MHTQDGCWEAALNLPVLHIPLCTRTCPLIYCPRSSASEKTHMYHSTLQPLGLTPARGIVSHPWQTQAIQPQFYLLPLSRYFFLSIETYSASIMLRFPKSSPSPPQHVISITSGAEAIPGLNALPSPPGSSLLLPCLLSSELAHGWHSTSCSSLGFQTPSPWLLWVVPHVL